LEADYVLADAGYDSKTNNKAVKAIDAELDIASNPRRGKRKKSKHAVLLKTKRYVVEQFYTQSKRTC
jgi:IS5 family transposase